MDKNHNLDTPHNEELQNIEQLTGHSELSTMYFRARNEWEGQEILSKEERELKRDREQQEITSSIRKWFVPIGLLIPVPVILLVLLIALASVFLDPDNLRYMLPVAILSVGLWGAVLYFSMRKVYGIFYQHALQATPFILIFMALLGLGGQASFLLVQPLKAEPLMNVALLSGCALILGVIISGILLTIWTSQRLSGSSKLGAIMCLAVVLIALIFGLAFF